MLLYLPSLFLMEEVVFRGVLDSHVQHEGEHHGLLTAIYVSACSGACGTSRSGAASRSSR